MRGRFHGEAAAAPCTILRDYGPPPARPGKIKMRYIVEIERPSACNTWMERFLVEVRSFREQDALERLAFSLDECERIVSCISDPSHYRDALRTLAQQLRLRRAELLAP